MLQIDRMEIDDVGGNPKELARAVLKQIPDLKPGIPVREIAAALDIDEIREEPLDKLEGCLITPDDKSTGSILIHKNRPETRKRYTIAHELGHYLSPWHKPATGAGFQCSARDMAADMTFKVDSAMRMEIEANQFAAELLMPTKLFQDSLKRRKGADLEHILELADAFEVSREAAARRYVTFVDEPAAIVFSKEGVIRYMKKSEYFPALCIKGRDGLPQDSLSAQSSLPAGEVSNWEAQEGHLWLTSPKGRAVCEQTLAQSNGFRMTLLTLEDGYDDEDEDDAGWAAPTFKRR